MRESILLASPSNLLTISLLDKECSLWLSPDRKSLMIEETLDRSISGVDMKLTRHSDNEILSSQLLPIRYPSSLISFRLDPFLPLIFENDVTLKTFDNDIPAINEWKKNLSQFSLNIQPIRDSDTWNDEFLPTVIYSDSLKIGSTSLAVSREILSLYSDFFCNLFFGSFLERNQEVKEIKDVSESEFVGFIQSLHHRRFEFNSVQSALNSLEFADRFLISEISKKVLPYLKKEKLSIEMVEYAFTVGARVHNNKELITWLLPQFPSKSRLLEMLHDSAPSMSTEVMQMCLSSSLKRARELESTVSDVEKETSLLAQRREIQMQLDERIRAMQSQLDEKNKQLAAPLELEERIRSMKSQLDEKNKQLAAPLEYNYKKMKKLIEPNEQCYKIGFHLMGYASAAHEQVEWENYVLRQYSYHPKKEAHLWHHIPNQFRTAVINGVTYTRNDTVHFNISGSRVAIVKVLVYRY